MTIQFFCPRWGSESLSWDAFCQKVKAAGYNGVEAGVSFDEREKDEMSDALQKYGLILIGQYWQSFEKHLYHIAQLKPLKIDAQTGKDYFSFSQNKELFETAFAFTADTGIPVAHETHRNKALFAAHITKHFLEQIPSLRITTDFSHWCNVSESFLEDQAEAIDIASRHAIHIHARVGHSQGAQVTDPRLPEWQEALQHHLRWWRHLIHHQKDAGATSFTITPEFGPAPYMPLAPHTQQPLADQWGINVWMMETLKREF